MSAVTRESLEEALRFQHAAVGLTSLSSPLYECMLDSVLEELATGGPTISILEQAPPGIEPIPDALVLRYLGGLHRLVLTGSAPALAARYPSAGGAFDPTDDAARRAVVAAYYDAVEEHTPALLDALSAGVQTNEVARSAALAVGFLEVARSTGLPLRLLEIGASAGLNLRWDRYRYEGGAGGSAYGPHDATVRFVDNYTEPFVDLAGDAVVSDRRGCDRSPIDPATEAGRVMLRSFIWPDQTARYALLDAALGVAAELPVTVEAADAAEWLDARLAEPADDTATVVFHSIVWQYLPEETQERARAALLAAGAAATSRTPLAWLRMEPGINISKSAELRLTLWPGGDDQVLARAGYHGRPVRAVLRDQTPVSQRPVR